MNAGTTKPRLLLVGGGTGLVGRHLLAELSPNWTIVSLHRRPSAEEIRVGVEFYPRDIGSVVDWSPYLRDVEMVVNVAWYRAGSASKFRPITNGLLRLVAAAKKANVPRFVHISVPDAPNSIETQLPYMVGKRRVDRAIEQSGLSYAIVRPTMLFAPRDVLVTVMMRTMHRYHRFPMFGDGEFHLSPLSASDLARIVRREALLPGSRNVTAGGPRRWRYRDLTDAMFASLGLSPKYVRLSPRGSIRLARMLEVVGSSLLYVYEVEWLLSDMLGLPPYEGLDAPLLPVEPFLAAEADRLRGPRSAPEGTFKPASRHR